MSVCIATMGKYWPIIDAGGGSGFGVSDGDGDGGRRKPVVTIGKFTTEDLDSTFEILKIEEEDL